MTQQTELLKIIDELPQKYFGEMIDFVGYLQHKAQQEANGTGLKQETREGVASLFKDDSRKIHFTRKELDEMVKNSPTLHKIAGILHTDMTLDEIRMARLAKHL